MFEFLLFWKRPKTPLEMALKEVEKKGKQPVLKGVEQLDEYFKKHPYNQPKKNRRKKH